MAENKPNRNDEVGTVSGNRVYLSHQMNVFLEELDDLIPPETGFRVYRTTSQGISAATLTQVNFNAASFNINGDFSLTNDEYIVPVDGYYTFHHQQMTTGLVANDVVRSIIYKNNALFVQAYDYAAGTSFQSNTVTVYDLFEAGDSIEAWTYGLTAYNYYNGAGNSYFMGKFEHY